MITIKDGTKADIPVIQEIAEKTWWPTYSSILSKEQIRYMLDVIYGTSTLEKVMGDNSQHFILLFYNNETAGFAAYGARAEDHSIYKVHKLYILPDLQGKGLGKLLLEEIKTRLSAIAVHTLDLHVNRYNPAKYFYERLGFQVIREEDVPIGPYWMNDYVMRLEF